MPHKDAAIDNHYLGLIRISGVDAKKLLQGQLTCQLDDVSTHQSQLGAHCNPQGRVISFFRLFFYQDAYYLQMRSEMIETAMNALQKYAVFFKVEIAPDDQALLRDTTISLPEWQYQNILAGIPTIYLATTGRFLPHEINLPQLNAVSFNKGCYTGQEIIARMHYRGQLKKHMYRASVKTNTLPAPGSDIFNEKPCGIVVDSCFQTENMAQLLVVTEENLVQTQTLFIDAHQKEPLAFFTLPNQVTHV